MHPRPAHFMKGIQPVDPVVVDAARRLYLKYGGRQHERIEKEMRESGHPFYRSLLYTTKHESGLSPGWIERFGWMEQLPVEQRRGLRQRNHGRHYFEDWLCSNFPEWHWRSKYQRYINKKLTAVTQGRCKRLMIFMPPRHGKSELVTVRYTAWRLIEDPALNVIIASYNQRLADKFSRKVKRIVQGANAAPVDARSENHPVSRPALARRDPPLLGKEGSRSLLNTASEWETAGGGVVRSVGVGAGIAGFGAGLIVIDDPVRNRADAESGVYRERVWEWFNDDIYTRMEPDAAIVLIQTRWHEDDLAGRLLKEMENGGERWDVVCLPALAEDDADPLNRKAGHALCPRRFPVKSLLRYKRKLGSYSFGALYQQRPAPAKGGLFKRAWFTKILEAPPPGLRWKRGYDMAVSTSASADHTASFRCAKDAAGNLYIADGFRARIEYPEQRRYIIERMLSEADTEHGIEAALHGRAVVQDLRRERGVGHRPLRYVRVDKDKLTRALAWLNLAEEGRVFLVRGPWIDDFIDEIARFPAGRHDDQIDAVSIAVAMLARSGDKRLWAF